jgi:hypothetical protein
MRYRRATLRLAACLLLGAGFGLIAIGAPPAAIIVQLVLAIICAVASLRVRDYP